MHTNDLFDSITKWLKRSFGNNCEFVSHKSLGGGSINDALLMVTSCGEFFVKYNLTENYPLMFESEARGLKLLKDTNTLHIPSVHHVGISGPNTFLILDYIKQGNRAKNYWELFAAKLADLHRVTHDSYGLDHNNYIGSLHQDNHPEHDYFQFLILRRLQPQVRLAYDAHLMTSGDCNAMDRLYKRLPDILPVEQPTLLHGDLWSGNLIVTNDGLPCIIDPSVHYGNRETDIAMTQLFGGFSESFYTLYNETFPLHKGWQQRMEIHQLYYLLVHVNLFGQSYTSQVQSIIRKF